MICIVCPVGCHLEVLENKDSESGYTVNGATCKRGEVYGVKELSNPTRTLTTTVKLNGGNLSRVPVRTDREIPKDKIFDCMRVINNVILEVPVKSGQVLVENILGLNVNIISSRSVE